MDQPRTLPGTELAAHSLEGGQGHSEIISVPIEREIVDVGS